MCKVAFLDVLTHNARFALQNWPINGLEILSP